MRRVGALDIPFLLPGIVREKHVLFSVINGWEIVIKYGTGKLTLPEPAETYIP
jgi:PIN domain nuclease of toxin-antitoxin system